MALQSGHHTYNHPATPQVASDGGSCSVSVDDIKALLRDHLPKDQTGANVYKGYIIGAADFQHHFQQYVSLSYRPAAFSGDFPDKDEDLRQLAKGLHDAMLNFADAIEAGQKSATRIYQLSPYEIELKSWELLFMLRDVQRGQVGLPGWGKLWAGEDFDSFMDRYNDAVSKLQVSKSMVSSLFDEAFTVRLALAPAAELKKKLANMNNNARRAVELAMIRGVKQNKQEKRAEASDHAVTAQSSKTAEDGSTRTATQLLGSKRLLLPQDHSAEGGQSLERFHPNKRPRSTNSYAASEDIHSGRSYVGSHGGHGTDANGPFAHGARKSSFHDDLPELVETPGHTPASELTDFSSLISSRANTHNLSQAPFDVDNPKTKAAQTLSLEYDALDFGKDAFRSSNDGLASIFDWSMNECANNGLMFGDYDNSSRSEAFSFNPGLDYSPDVPHGATRPVAAQGLGENGSSLNFDFEQTHKFPPAGTWLHDGDGRNSEAVTLTPGDSNDPIVDKHTFDVDQSLGNAVVSDDLLALDPNAAVRAFYNEDGTLDKFGMMKTV